MFGGGTEAFRLYGSVGVDPKPAMQGLDNLTGHVQKSGGIIQNAMGTALGFLGGQYMKSAIDKGVGFLKGAAIDYNASMEQASIGFTTLLGSAEKAQAFIADMQDFAAKTPFDFPGLQTSANQMLAMGFASDDILPTLTAVGDAVAALGGGSAEVQRATTALGQMRAAGRVNAQDMMQLTSLGIPAWQLLADSIGKSVPETRKLAEQGLIPAQQALDAITSGIEKSPMGGMMAAQAKTFRGAMSTISDSLNMAAGKALKPFFDLLSSVAIGFATWLGTDQATAFFDGIANAISGAFHWLGRLGKAAKGFLKPVADAAGVIGDLFRDWQAGALLDDLNAMAQDWFGVYDVVGQVQGAFDAILPVVTDLADQVMSFLAPALQLVQDNFDTIATFLVGTFLGPWGTLVTVFQAVASGASDIGGAVATMQQSAMASLGALIEQAVPILATMAGQLADWVLAAIPPFLDNLASWFESMGTFLLDSLPGVVAKLAEWGGALIGWVLPRLPGLLGNLLSFVGRMGSWFLTVALPKIVGMAGDLGLGLVNGFLKFVVGPPGLLERIGTFVTGTLIPGIGKYGPGLLKSAGDIAGQFVKGFLDFLGTLPNKIADVIRKAFQGLKIDVGPFHISGKGVTIDLPNIDLPHFAVGSWNVPATMPAVVHQGEMILPADVADRLRKFGGIVGGGGGALAAATPSGPTIVVNIGTFYGTQANIDALSRSLAERARYGG